MSKAAKSSFVHGALILVIANMIVKAIGAIYSIPLYNLIGDAGNGYYGVANELYGLLFVLSTAGLPIAISKMVSESYALGKYSEVKRIFRVAFITFTIVGIMGSLVMILGSKQFAISFNNDLSYAAIVAIAPAVFFVSIISSFRGYFQGMGNMVPTGISQVIEALCKLFIGLFLSSALIKASQPMYIVSAGAISGVTIGTMLSAVALIFMYMASSQRKENARLEDRPGVRIRTRKEIFITLVKFAVPITIGASVMSLTNTMDLFVVMNRLGDIGFNQEHANVIFGNYTMARKIFNLPASLIFTLGISVMPVLSAAYATKDHRTTKHTIESALRICSIFAIPAGVGLLSLSYPVLNLLFYAQPNSVASAAPLLARLSFATTFVCLVSLTNAMLQAVGRVNIPVFTMIIGGIVKLVTNYVLIGIPSIGILGAPIGSSLCYIVIAVLNIFYIVKEIGIMPDFISIFVKPLMAATAMGFCAVWGYDLVTPIIGAKLATIVAMGVAIIVYFSILAIIKGFVKADVKLLPKGEKIAAFLEKRNLLG